MSKKSDSMERSWTYERVSMIGHLIGHTHLINNDMRDLIKCRSSLPAHTPILQHLQSNPIRDIGQPRLGANVAVKPNRVPHQTVARLNGTGRLALFKAHTLREGDGRNSPRFCAENLAWDTARELVFEYERRKLGAFAAPSFSAQDEDLVGGESLKN
jgi:hypothetical protein